MAELFGQLLVKAHDKAYADYNTKIHSRMDTIENCQEQIGTLVDFLTQMNDKFDAAKKHGQERISFDTEQERDLVDKLRVLLPGSIDDYAYSWEDRDSFDRMAESIKLKKQEIEGKIQTETSHTVELYDNRKNITEICSKLLDRFIRHIEHFVDKQIPR